ncbi:hypothetical protein F8S09_16500 [Deinococcus sp. SDU3-2]|uniref:Uncharacterized protein n=1 Tax=Deinococcus terrestris TaxID=2651870 RepID=A0A7X1NYQ9_9DEIO|nr:MULTISPECIES: hypothetical protein [Deinococcus]MPY68258.1 hypothetical protein [Deinococcus terrestris]
MPHPAFLILSLLALVGAGTYVATELRWRSPTYCIERRGQVWNGEAGALPTDYRPQCPASSSYRAEVRRGDTRVEQYVTSGWHPEALAEQFKAQGFRELDAELITPGLYEVILEKSNGKVYYLAARQGDVTEITINGQR